MRPLSRQFGPVSLVLLFGMFACGEEGGLTKKDKSCASEIAWAGGDEESPLMLPGEACVECHEGDREAPVLSVAGTVYDASGQADGCFGVEGYTVEVTDADGGVHKMTTNRAGNFYIERGSISTPYTARIINPDGTQRQMVAPQVVTDCNSCHTITGANAAPGRL